MLAGLIVLLACPKPPSINPAWFQITGDVQCPSSFYVLEPCYSRFSCSVVDCNWTPREPAMPMHFGWWDARRHGGAGVTIWVTTFAGNVGLSQRTVGRTICFARAASVSGCSAGLYSIDAICVDAICVGSLWCADRTLPRVMPTTNITASITAITPSFRGALSLRICLSKSSWSRRSIFTSPIFVDANATKLPPFR
jgi:hypothetical protein